MVQIAGESRPRRLQHSLSAGAECTRTCSALLAPSALLGAASLTAGLAVFALGLLKGLPFGSERGFAGRLYFIRLNERQEAKIRKGEEHGATTNGSDHL